MRKENFMKEIQIFVMLNEVKHLVRFTNRAPGMVGL